MGDFGAAGGHIATTPAKPIDAGVPAPVSKPDVASDGSLAHLSALSSKSPLFGNNDGAKAK